MKNIFYLALVLICTQSCGVSQSEWGSGPKNLIQNSEFAIVTPQHDTLFLCHDDMMGKFLAQCWKEGKFKDSTQPAVVVLDCNNFDKLAQRVYTPSSLVSNEAK
jgi:hypothetical protein